MNNMMINMEWGVKIGNSKKDLFAVIANIDIDNDIVENLFHGSFD